MAGRVHRLRVEPIQGRMRLGRRRGGTLCRYIGQLVSACRLLQIDRDCSRCCFRNRTPKTATKRTRHFPPRTRPTSVTIQSTGMPTGISVITKANARLVPWSPALPNRRSQLRAPSIPFIAPRPRDRCAPRAGTASVSTNSCHTVTLPAGGDSYTDRDWDYYYYKVSCSAHEVVVGVSTDTANHHPHAILCCRDAFSPC